MAEKKSKTRSRYSIGEWYGRAFEFFSPKRRRDQAKLHAGLTTIAGLACPFQKNRICTKKGGVCSLRRYEQIDDGPVKGTGPLVTTCPNRFLEDDTIFRWIGEEILRQKLPLFSAKSGFLPHHKPKLRDAADVRFCLICYVSVDH
jgi:Restriction endonuclease NotI